MHSQKPVWRKACSWPSSAMSSRGFRSRTLESARYSKTPGSKQKKPPLIQCSERGFSVKPVTRPSPSSAVTPKGSSGRTTVIVASVP